MEIEPGAPAAAVWVDGERVHACALEEALRTVQRGAGVAWIRLTLDDPQALRRILQDGLGVHPVAVDDALEPVARPGVHTGEDWVYLSASVIEEDGRHDQYRPVGMFAGERFLVTVEREPIALLSLWFDRWARKPQEVGQTPPYLLHTLLDAIVDDFFPALDRVQTAIAEQEDAVYRGERGDAVDAIQAKRAIVEMRRRVIPIRDALNSLLRRDVSFVPEGCRAYYQDVYDHALRVVEDLDLNRDILTTILDAQLNVTSNRLNEVMRFMTVISTVLMSMALVSGVYGMNFRLMPELAWPFGYPLAIGLMLLIAAVEVWLFRRKGWL